MPASASSKPSLATKREMLRCLTAKARARAENALAGYYPDEGPLRRALYPRHLDFFRAGAEHRQRLMLAANRVGKTEGVGGFELTLHLTGLYPHWWEGRRFTRPVRAWACGDTAESVREILQKKLLGPPDAPGTGLIPRRCIDAVVRRGGGVADAVERVAVRHAAGGMSWLKFKSYDQKRKAFQGTEQDVVWLDEEPPMDVYAECLMRTMTTDGLVMLTFTPLLGLSEVVLSFLPGGRIPAPGEAAAPGKHLVTATWDDVPHLSAAQKRELWEQMPPHQREARARGVPQLGAGAIYPVPEEEIAVAPFEIPAHWPRVFGMDVGWNRTAVVWGALDRTADVLYLVGEHARGLAEPEVHAAAIRARGEWIPGVIDPAARGRSQADGKSLLDIYQGLGLDVSCADNAVEAGLYRVWSRLSTGRLKVFANCSHWFEEYRLYRRDAEGKVVKDRDHLMDATRYLVSSGLDLARETPPASGHGGASGAGRASGGEAANHDYEMFT